MKYYLIILFFWGLSLYFGFIIESNSLININNNLEDIQSINIIKNNLYVASSNVLLSLFSGGLYSIFNSLNNGFMNGILIRTTLENELFRSYLEYSLFENIGLIISNKLGLKLGVSILKTLFKDCHFTMSLRIVILEIILVVLFIIVGGKVEPTW